MKFVLFSVLSLAMVSSGAFASPDGDSLYGRSYVSVNKGDCIVENADGFAPRIESFKIILQTQAVGQNQGDAFLYYNMLGTSVGVMTSARYTTDQATGQKLVSSDILIGLSDVAQVQLKPILSNLGEDQKSTGSIAISKNGKTVFTSTFSCGNTASKSVSHGNSIDQSRHW